MHPKVAEVASPFFSSISDAKSKPTPKPKIAKKCTAFSGLQTLDSPTRFHEDPLYNALRKVYGIDDKETAAVLKSLVIIHPYGTMADMPWQNGGGIPFGFAANRPNLLMTSGHIKTYTEQVEESDTLEAIRWEVAEAETIVFLGFSYHELNMKLLDPGRECAVRNIFGTASGISPSDVEEIKDQIRRLVRRDLVENKMSGGRERITERLYIRSDLKCDELFDEYSRGLFMSGRRSAP